MRRRPFRAFSLRDAMALVAATAVGLALHRAFWADAPYHVHAGNSRALLLIVMVPLTPGALVCTPTILAFQFWPPQGRWRRRLSCPGGAVCCAATSALLVGIALMGFVKQGRNDFFLINDLMLFGLPALAGGSVVSTWVLLILLQGYQPSSDWADRLGRIVGLYWLLWIPVLGWSLIGP